jgi:hypothetical protein
MKTGLTTGKPFQTDFPLLVEARPFAQVNRDSIGRKLLFNRPGHFFQTKNHSFWVEI